MTTEHIKIPAVSPRIQYVGNGVETQFSFPFPIFDNENIAIWLNTAKQIAGYTVDGAEESNGGTIIFDTPPPNNTVITIERRMYLQRVTDFLEGGAFSAETLNTELDYLTALIQQINSDNAPMLRFDNSEAFDVVTLPSKANRMNKVMGFDGSGNPTVFDTTNTYATPNFTATGTGAMTRTLSDKAGDIVSVLDYGAVGDGLNDDTAAFQTALTQETHLYIPAGTYLLSSTIEINDNQTIFGAGKNTILKANGSTFDALHVIGSYATVFNISIEGGDTGLRLYGKNSQCAYNTIQNITITDTNIAIELDGFLSSSTRCNWNSFDNIRIIKPAIHGVFMTVTSGGSAPKANSFKNIRVISENTPIAGHGFYIETAGFNNSFIDCEANLNNTTQACFRIGGFSDKTLITNLFCLGSGGAPSLQLDNGSSETSVTNLFSNDDNAVILDYSGGEYMAFNAGFPGKNRLRQTRISELTVELQRFDHEETALSGSGNVALELNKTTHLVDASNGETTITLPKADASNNGATVTIKKTDNSDHNVIIAENGGNGPNQQNFMLGNQHDYLTVLSDGSLWHVINSNTLSGNSFHHSGAGIFKPDLTHELYTIDASTGLVTVELPPADSAQSSGRMVTIKKIDSTAYDVRITEEGGNGPDNSTVILGSRYDAAILISDGSDWHIAARYDV